MRHRFYMDEAITGVLYINVIYFYRKCAEMCSGETCITADFLYEAHSSLRMLVRE